MNQHQIDSNAWFHKWRPPHFFLHILTPPTLWYLPTALGTVMFDFWWMSYDIKTLCVPWANPTWMIFANANNWRREIKIVNNECSFVLRSLLFFIRAWPCRCARGFVNFGICVRGYICSGIYFFKLNVNCGCKHSRTSIASLCVHRTLKIDLSIHFMCQAHSSFFHSKWHRLHSFRSFMWHLFLFRFYFLLLFGFQSIKPLCWRIKR